MKRVKKVRRLGMDFFRRDAETVARELVGKILVCVRNGIKHRARLTEAEAYVGEHDLACHAAKGRTGRTEVMFRTGGCAYVYLIYGMYDMLNIVTGDEGDAQAVLIRAGEALDGWEADLRGPGKLAREMGITRKELNGEELSGEKLWVEDDGWRAAKVEVSARIGVDYAGAEWSGAMLRFFDGESRFVSGKRRKG